MRFTIGSLPELDTIDSPTRRTLLRRAGAWRATLQLWAGALFFGLLGFGIAMGSLRGLDVGLRLAAATAIGVALVVTFQQFGLARVRRQLRRELRHALRGGQLPICLSCGYDLAGVRGMVCPECGASRIADSAASPDGAVGVHDARTGPPVPVDVRPAGPDDAAAIAALCGHLTSTPVSAETVRARLAALDVPVPGDGDGSPGGGAGAGAENRASDLGRAPDHGRAPADPAPRDLVLVAETSERTVVGWLHATVTARLQADPAVEIVGMAVDPQVRRGGVGTALWTAAVVWTERQGVARLRVRTRADRLDAVAFYARVGHRVVKEQLVMDAPAERSSPASVRDARTPDAPAHDPRRPVSAAP